MEPPLIQDSNGQNRSSSCVPGFGVVCWVHGGHTEDGRMRLMILPRFGGDDRGGRFYAVMARSLCTSSLGLANGGGRASGFTPGGCLFFEDGLFDGTEHERGEMADGFGGAELELATAELVDGIGQQLDYGWLGVRFQGAQQEGGEIANGLGGAHVHLATAEV